MDSSTKLNGRPRPTALRYIVGGLVLAMCCGAVWRFGIYRSDVYIGLRELRDSLGTTRPIETRISGLDHLPFSATREDPGDSAMISRDRAEQLLTTSAAEHDDAVSLAALGKFHLAQRNFSKANEFFERSVAKNKANSPVFADWGASLIEQAKSAHAAGDRTQGVKLFDQALGRLTQAVQLDPRTADASFNRALCLEALYLKDQAITAWNGYLIIDQSSKWADEARQRLEILNASTELSAKELREAFLAASSARDNDLAWRLLSTNRELITQKYIPQNLAMTITESPIEERPRLLDALDLAGSLESENIGDGFAAEIARFYRSRPEADIARLAVAHVAVKKGYELSLNFKFSDALNEFKRAQEIFEEMGSVWEANLSSYFVGYCQINTGAERAAVETIGKVVDFAHARQFKWLEMTALHWYAGAKRLGRLHAESTVHYRRALALANAIGDDYGIQRNFLDIANNVDFLGQYAEAVPYVNQAFENAFGKQSSLRQRQRNAQYGSQIYFRAGFTNAAKAASDEAIVLVDRSGDLMFRTNARSIAANIFARTGDLEKARKLVDDGVVIARSIDDEKSRNKASALAYIQAASIAEGSSDWATSTQMFREADRILDIERIPYHQYVAKKGMLYGLKSLGQYDELDARLPETIKLIEEYRGNIEVEKERTSFFDNGITIFDIAIERELEKGDLTAAFNLTERTASRSLIDRLNNSGDPTATATTGPLTIHEVRSRIEPDVQIVKFTVLEKRLMVWIIAKDGFEAVSVEINAADLRQKTESYSRLIRQGLPSDVDAIKISGQELFELLFSRISDRLDPARETILIPSKFLFHLPFGALADRAGDPLIQTYTIGYAPSATVYLAATAQAASRAGGKYESLLAVGNPSFSRSDFPDLADLPAAESEVSSIATQYNEPKLLLNERAQKIVFMSLLGQADVVHFAGHYVVAQRDTESSYMLFASDGGSAADSILTNQELDKLRLARTRLVVLAACDSGIESYFDGEGMVGLTRTFLAAGTPVVVASQWRVDSAAAAELMKRFHANRRARGMSTSQALRAAQLDLANEPAGRFRNPFYWAAFAVFGGSSPY